jgi:hypothetical protein
MKMLPLLLSVMACSCVNQAASNDRPSAEATRFFTDYVANDGPEPDTLPVFLRACNGDQSALDAIFSDYARFGSGDNEAWGEVPDTLLAELGDQRFSTYASKQNLEGRVAVLKWLGDPGSSLCDDSDSRRLYPKTAALQEALFASHPTARP